MAFVSDMCRTLEIGETQVRQQIVQQVVEKNVVRRDRVRLHYQFPPNPKSLNFSTFRAGLGGKDNHRIELRVFEFN